MIQRFVALKKKLDVQQVKRAQKTYVIRSEVKTSNNTYKGKNYGNHSILKS